MGMPFAELETRLLLATILQHYTPRLVPLYILADVCLNILILVFEKQYSRLVLIYLRA